ncbi:Crp/Fnr family transcriptional regulator [Jannaschia sp. EhC01]|nr:Crp/Fnr family transcriptional regulator [Jannaschia sp. EhC01]
MSTRRAKPIGILDESLLAPLPLFSTLAADQIREVLSHATSQRYDPGTTIFAQGHDATRFYLLLDGHIHVVRATEQGDRVIALHISSGELFGIAQALGHIVYPASAVAAADCIALSWPAHFWGDFIARYEGFATETYRKVGHRIEEMSSRILELATLQVEQRVASALLRLIHQSGRKVDNGIEVGFPITRQDLSDMTGTTLHTVSRLLSAWQREGVIDSQRKRITVCNPHRLVILSGASGAI